MTLYYQPRMSVSAGLALGAEAFVRWLHPTQGLLTPAQFMPIAEEAGVSRALGDWVIRSACGQLAAWHESGAAGLRMAVNVSSRQFSQEDFIARLRASIHGYGIRADALEIDITEATLLRHAERAGRILRQAKELGVRVVVDDFGTGYSSLSCLERFPVDAVKIDQSLVAQIPRIPGASGLARAVIAVGRSLGLEVTAEGVETHGQCDFLAGAGCDSMQGNYFCAPAPAAAAEKSVLQRFLHTTSTALSSAA